jgi:acyl-CoA synthetase (AMP-forming)/AMP-acid ligase II
MSRIDTGNIENLVTLLQFRAQENQAAYYYHLDLHQETSADHQEINTKATKIAGFLQTLLTPEAPVLILCPSNLEFIYGFFGCLYAKNIAIPAYPPLTSKTQQEFLSLMEQTKPAAILTTSSLLAKIKTLSASYPQLFESCHILSLEDIGAATSTWQPPLITGDDVAFLQYTSGTTGTAKAVPIRHRDILQSLQGLQQHAGYDNNSRGVVWLPPYHDMGLVCGILTPLYSGFSMHLMQPTHFLQNPYQWLHLMSLKQATVSAAPAFAYELCIKHISAKQCRHLNLSHWQTALISKHPFSYELLKQFSEAFEATGFKEQAFFPCYGLSETGFFVTGKPSSSTLQTLNIAKDALKKNQIQIVSAHQDALILVSSGNYSDSSLRIVENEYPAEELKIGEIIISQQNENLTNYLKTDDLGFHYQNQLFILGRKQDVLVVDQASYYAHHLEWSAVHSHPALNISGCAAFLKTAEQEQKLIILAEITEKKLSADEYQNICFDISKAIQRDHHLLPNEIILIPPQKLPKTSNGKIQRSLCEEYLKDFPLTVLFIWKQKPEDSQITMSQELKAQHQRGKNKLTHLEHWFCHWIKNQIGLSLSQQHLLNPLNQLGIDSIQLMKLTHDLNHYLGFDFDSRLLLHSMSLIELFQHILKSTSNSSQPALEKAQGEQRQTTSYLEEWIWEFIKKEPSNPAYNIPYALSCYGELDTGLLEKSIKIVIKNHDILRSYYKKSGGQLQRHTLPTMGWTLETIDLSHLTFAKQEISIQQHLQWSENFQFDTQHAPLFIIKLLKLNIKSFVLLLNFSHLIIDSWSVGIFLREVGDHYHALFSQKSKSVTAPEYDYADYAIWQKKLVNSSYIQNQIDYWNTVLPQLNAMALPYDKPRKKQMDFNGAQIVFSISKDEVHPLNKIANHLKTSLYTILLSGLQLMLYQFTQQTEMSIKLVTANRHHPDLYQMMGLIAHSLPFHQALNPSWTNQELIERTHHILSLMHQHQDVPFEIFQEFFPQWTDHDPSGLSVSFSYDHFPLAMRMGNVVFDTLSPIPKSVAIWNDRTDIALIIQEQDEGLLAILRYRSECFNESTMWCLAESYRHHLHAFLSVIQPLDTSNII